MALQAITATCSLSRTHEFRTPEFTGWLIQTSKIVADAKHVNVKLSSFKMVIYPDPDALPDVPLPLVPARKLTSLDASHANLLNNTWSQGANDQCLKYLINLICCFPSMCILDEHECPISWGLTDQFATIIHGYTLPKHRRKGYNCLIATNLAKMLHSKGFPAHGNVLEDNLPSLTLLKSMNARFLPCQFVRLIHTPFFLLAKPE
ncbi:glycine N-acyltransferase-like protein 3 [Erythrolamprus reginae]|uniref:glycine N-acyltransferase-like protein 3 n=1 Tax=Erythrolamprus reginae TaxID=121349 RepID=UPI00396C5886